MLQLFVPSHSVLKQLESFYTVFKRGLDEPICFPFLEKFYRITKSISLNMQTSSTANFWKTAKMHQQNKSRGLFANV
jgi:hypothetical protein